MKKYWILPLIVTILTIANVVLLSNFPFWQAQLAQFASDKVGWLFTGRKLLQAILGILLILGFANALRKRQGRVSGFYVGLALFNLLLPQLFMWIA
ncbi:hypothetical protein RU97_GL001987 [Enterococcus canis]|uniref:Uncharacterized protein n=1 Tax=Enterococcus canis TaxID=214095 RepID=A0A1L8RFP3_9ENTE|nr:hypothetical protein [Enterococcus canis]OJG18590.1 hypothetical protein RU97_GL001987 [Enterococcus canis]